MIDVVNDELVVEEKGIYSIENFLSSRRLMYWQVYLHKTTVSSEEMLIQLMARARHLIRQGSDLEMPEALKPFFYTPLWVGFFFIGPQNFLNLYSLLDDYDIWFCIKSWVNYSDFVLSFLAKGIMDRRLLKVQIFNQPLGEEELIGRRKKASQDLGISDEETAFLVFERMVSNSAYVKGGNRINIKTRSGTLTDVSEGHRSAKYSSYDYGS
jgi:hypothetical protein